MNVLKRLMYLPFLWAFVFVFLSSANAQMGFDVKEIVQWAYDIEKTGDNTYTVSATATIKDGWYIYGIDPGGDGSQIPTDLVIDDNELLFKKGKPFAAPQSIEKYIEELEMTINIHKNKVIVKQELIAKENTTLTGFMDFQTCNDDLCLPPIPDSFKLAVENVVAAAFNQDEVDALALGGEDAGTEDSSESEKQHIHTGVSDEAAASVSGLEKASLWELFIAGLVAGFIAFIMPCIYAMLPITVSFFTKRSKDKATGIRNAVIYSLSIILIFTAIGALISLLFNESTMYRISISMGFNLFVFALFVFFGISLLGAFEINLPSSWSNKLDSKANTNNVFGIFFMALVLVVVSFSCTSAFISTLIIYIVNSGNSLGGVVGFFGFGLAIALPFALFALFPSMLNNIAKSGGWLNAVKVSMGFVELALAMKFLSNVDLQHHWGLLDFEVYLSIWIIIFGLLGFYLLGIIRFAKDDALPKNDFGQPYLSVTRLFFAIAALSFTTYMIPGLWGAPLTGISGFLPERKTLEFNIHDNLIQLQSNVPAHESEEAQQVRPMKYANLLKSELPGITTYFDFEEALEAARKLKKPVFLDFTGHSCVNCRKMERAVLSKPEVLRDIKQNFIFVSLYCDDKTTLPTEEQYVGKDGTKITTMGAKNLDLQISKFNAVAQPLYVFVDEEGNLIKDAGGYVPDVQRFLGILEEVKQTYNKRTE